MNPLAGNGGADKAAPLPANAAPGRYNEGPQKWNGPERRGTPPSGGGQDNWSRWMSVATFIISITGIYWVAAYKVGTLEERLTNMLIEQAQRRQLVYSVPTLETKLENLERRHEYRGVNVDRVLDQLVVRLGKLEDGGTSWVRSIQEDVQEIRAAVSRIEDRVRNVEERTGPAIMREWGRPSRPPQPGHDDP